MYLFYVEALDVDDVKMYSVQTVHVVVRVCCYMVEGQEKEQENLKLGKRKKGN